MGYLMSDSQVSCQKSWIMARSVDSGSEQYRNPVYDQAKFFIRHLATLDPLHHPTAEEALRDPWLASTPSHADIAPTLRQNWSPRAKWRSAVTRVRAADRFAAAAAASWSSMQSSGEWHEEQEQEQEEVMQGAFEPVCRDLENVK